MRIFIVLFLLLISVPALAEGFLAAAEDIPLAPGLEEVAEATLVYEKPDGRIIEETAVGPLSPEQVQSFYAETLPQLGWQAESPFVYRRDKEKLTLDIISDQGGTEVRFTLTPDQ